MNPESLTVGELRCRLAGLPDDMPIGLYLDGDDDRIDSVSLLMPGFTSPAGGCFPIGLLVQMFGEEVEA
jgi:hypothetical protein